MTYSCCTAVPGGSCAVHVHAARPSDVSLVTSARLHLASIDVAGLRRNSAGSNPSADEFVHSRQQNGDAGAGRPCEGLATTVSMCKLQVELCACVPNSDMERPDPMRGMESLRVGGLKSLPLLFKLSTARFTSKNLSARSMINIPVNKDKVQWPVAGRSVASTYLPSVYRTPQPLHVPLSNGSLHIS